MSLTCKTDHLQEARDNFISQFQGRPNVEALADAYVQQIQELEDALCQLLQERTIETAIGTQLDNLGKIVGQIRGNRDDDLFRIFLRSRILVNKSNGTINDLLEVVRTATEGGTPRLIEYGNASMEITMVTVFAGDVAQVAVLIRDARPAGVACNFSFASTIAPAFQFDTSGQGFDLGHYGDVVEA